MSQVVLLAINAKYIHSSLAVWVVAGGVSKYACLSHNVKIIETTIRQSYHEIAWQVAAYSPDVVGISAYIWNAEILPELLKTLRELIPGVIIVLGGPEASYNAEYWLGNGADHVVSGCGERRFPALLDCITNNVQKGIKCNVEPLLSEPAPGEYIDPYSDAYFDALCGRIAYIETSRGCPFRCSFCLSGGTGVSFFPIEKAKEQILKLSRSGTRTIKFVDRTFNCDAGRAHELFEYIIGLNTACRFHFEVAADLFDERTLTLLATAPPGLIQFEAGLQSFYEPALNASYRKTNLSVAEKNIRRLLHKQNIHIHVDLIAGLPLETLSHFQNSFDRAYALGAHTLQLGFLKLLHGSALRMQADALKIRYGAAPPYEITGSPWLSAEDIRILKQAENALQHTYNKSRFLSTLDYVLGVSGLRPFSLFRKLGEAVPNHGTQLQDYTAQLFRFFAGLPDVDGNTLREHMVCDWLSMVKGENMPHFLKKWDTRKQQIAAAAEKRLGHVIRRDESAVLPSGKVVFVDSADRDPVTGLYRVYQC